MFEELCGVHESCEGDSSSLARSSGSLFPGDKRFVLQLRKSRA